MVPSRPTHRRPSPGRGRAARAEGRTGGTDDALFGQTLVAPVQGIPRVLSDLGLDPVAVLAELRVDAGVFDRADNRIAFADVGRILDYAARLAECPHIGLLLGRHVEPAALGAADLVLRARTVGAALRNFVLYRHLNDTGGGPRLLSAPGNRAVLAYSVYAGHPPGLAHILDLCAVIGMRLLRALCGPSWAPLRIHLPHRPPEDAGPYREALGPHVAFDGELLKIVFAASWLTQPVVAPPPPAGNDLETPAEADPLLSLPLPEVVRRALRPMVFTGTATQNAMADLLSMHPRSLSRHLHKAGTSFQALLNDARLDIARQLLAETDLTVTEIAAALHYSDMTAFTRAFRTRSGTTPSRWRAAQAAPRPAERPSSPGS